MKAIKFSVLDALRGLAAIFVVIRHSGEFFGGNPFYSSFLAVDIFFLLSGFVIAHAYDAKILRNDIQVGEFILIRLIRFYPVYLLSLLLCVFVALIKFLGAEDLGNRTIGNFILTLFFIPNFLQTINIWAALFPINSVIWSLFFELTVNIFYALTKKINIEKVLAILTFMAAAAIFIFAAKDGSIDAGFSWGLDSIALGGSRAFFGIFFGIYLYKIKDLPCFARLNTFSTFGPIVVIMLLLAMPKLALLNWLYQACCVLILFPLCVIWAAKARPQRFEKVFLSLGLMSYPAYVLHVPLAQLLNQILASNIRYFAPLSGIVFIATLFILSLLVERYFERPLIKSWRGSLGKLKKTSARY